MKRKRSKAFAGFIELENLPSGKVRYMGGWIYGKWTIKGQDFSLCSEPRIYLDNLRKVNAALKRTLRPNEMHIP